MRGLDAERASMLALLIGIEAVDGRNVTFSGSARRTASGRPIFAAVEACG
jgi:hypothetical protein